MFLIGFEHIFIVSALHMKIRLIRKQDTVVILHLAPSVVVWVFNCIQMNLATDHLRVDVHAAVIKIVCHWNHRG